MRPWRSLRARVGLTFGGLIILLALLLTLFIERPAQAQIEEDIGQTLATLAFQLADTLDRELLDRAQDLQTLATLDVILDPQAPASARTDLFDEVRQTYGDYLWLGLADRQGTITAGSGPLPVGLDISSRPWYQAARRGFYARALQEPLLSDRERVLALAVPVVDANGDFQGEVAAYLNLAGIEKLPASWQEAAGTLEETDAFVLTGDGTVLFTTAAGGTRPWSQPASLGGLEGISRARRGDNLHLAEVWPDGETYLTGYARSRPFGSFPGVDWLVLVRQPIRVAYRPVQALQRRILAGGVGLAFLFLFVGWWLAGRTVRPLSAIAGAAERIRRGERGIEIPEVGGGNELGLLSDSLRTLVAELTAQKQALAESQQALERKVAERTRTLAALYHILEVTSATDDLQTALGRALAPVLEATGAESGFVHLLSPARDTLVLVAHASLPADVIPALQTLPVRDDLLGRVVRQRRPLVTGGLRDDPLLGTRLPEQSALSFAGVPVVTGNRVLGVLSVIAPAPPGRETVELLASVGEELGVVVGNTRLRQREEELAVLQERNRLARELHDSVTQSLYSITLLAEAGRRLALSGDTERTVEYLSYVGETGHQALKEMRLLLHKLRPLALQQEGLVAALRRRLDAVEGKIGITYHLQSNVEEQLPASVEEALYHIAQEALNNALKHAQATEVSVTLAAGENGEINLTVADNGCGFDPDTADGAGMGLSTMHERAQRFGGDVIITTAPGEGTTMRAWVQIRPASGYNPTTPQPSWEPTKGVSNG